jgi:hypothetical protein
VAFFARLRDGFAAALLAGAWSFFVVLALVALAAGGVVFLAVEVLFVARFEDADPLVEFAADRFAPALAGALVAVRFTGSSVDGLALVAATYTPSVGLTSGALGRA